MIKFLVDVCIDNIVDSLVVLIMSIKTVITPLECWMMIAFQTESQLLLIDMSEREVEDNCEDSTLQSNQHIVK